MNPSRSPRYFLAAALLALLVALLLPMQSALAGGCCFKEIRIKSLATGREVVITGPALTSGYDLSNFGSFADFPTRTAAPLHPGPGYEVIRYDNQTAWDHLRYYPGVAGAPGAAYYEGLFNGSSEYDDQWFAVTAAQDAALRQVLANRGFTPSPQPLLPLTVVALAAFSLIPLIGARRSRTRLTPALATLDAPHAESDI
jgi:hypothetical protein